ncbi:MAG TPA: S41 family peptidase [Candidatus Tectomicrobia bacterium]|nr:S41 family peptidase [Candidatus Tectomicrobia bacterium]
MAYAALWRRAAFLAVFALLVGCLSCGLTATGYPREPNPGRPEVFVEVTRVVESSFWDVNKLNPQTLFKGAVDGVDGDVRSLGGTIGYKGKQMVVSLNGHSKAVDLSSIESLAEMVHAFGDVYAFLLRHQHLNGLPTNWEYRAIEGMVKSLDGNSAFMPPHEFREMQEETRGSFGGIGIRIGVEDGRVVIVEPMDGTPAAKAGLKQGDQIVRIDGQPTQGLTLQEAVRRMRGPVGSRLVLGIVRRGGIDPEDVPLTRAKIDLKTVENQLLDGRIGYIKVRGFHETTLHEMERALNRLAQQKMEGLILDLRNNPGGLLSQSVKVCNLFVDEGLIVVSTEGRLRNQNSRFMANGGGQYRQYSLLVLINAGSASGSEIVAGALQDLQKATIIGTKSYGKGSVQTIFPLQDGSGLRLTTAHYFTPSGRSIDHIGITPDIELANEGKEDRQLNMAHAIMKEALAMASRRKHQQPRGSGPIDNVTMKELGRGMLAAPPTPSP